jgi:hypothetical protein
MPASAEHERFDWRLLGLGYLGTAAILIGKAIYSSATTPLVNDTDDAMRLVTVRDLLAGQGWWDHLQHRLDTPFGAEIHWSHLIDAAIGGLMLGLRSLAGASAETIALYAWPLLLLLALMSLCAVITFRLGGREAMLPAVVLPLLSPALIAEFSPGRIDHHSIQILLTLLMAWASIEAMARPRFAALAGLAAALSLEVGIEGLPSIASAIVAIAVPWAFQPDRRVALRFFALPFALVTVLLEMQHFPPARWLQPACDEISPVYVAFALGVGLVLALLSVLPLDGRRPWVRLAMGVGLAAALGLGLAATFPLCLGGPYAALDPWLVHNWLDQIAEARPILDSFRVSPAVTLSVAVPPVLGMAAMVLRLTTGPRQGRAEWLILALFLAIALLVMAAQIRGGRLAAPLAIPAAGWLVATARQRYLARPRLLQIAGLVGSWLGFAGVLIGLVAGHVLPPTLRTPAAEQVTAAAVDPTSCRMPQAFAGLAALPPARVMTPIDLGSHLLAFTPDSVVAAPYHRDQDGVRDAFRFFNDPIAEARAILVRRGVGLVVICPGMPEVAGMPDAAPDSFARLYAKDMLPDWLEPLPFPGPLKVYRVAAAP